MQWLVSLNVETKRPYMRVCDRRHVVAPDHPEAGCRFLPLAMGPVSIQGVRDPMGGPGFPGVRTSMGGPELPAARAVRLSFPGTRGALGTNQRTGPGPPLGEQGSGPQGSGCWT